MALRIVFTARAEKEFLGLAAIERDRFRERLIAYAAEPASQARHPPAGGAARPFEDAFRRLAGHIRRQERNT